jgi:hypothetical protein
LEFTKKRLGQVGESMKFHELHELGMGAQEDYQILEEKVKKVEKKVAKVIYKGNEVIYAKVKKKVEK